MRIWTYYIIQETTFTRTTFFYHPGARGPVAADEGDQSPMEQDPPTPTR